MDEHFAYYNNCLRELVDEYTPMETKIVNERYVLTTSPMETKTVNERYVLTTSVSGD